MSEIPTPPDVDSRTDEAPAMWEIVGIVDENAPPATSTDITAAGWLWAIMREIQFDPEAESDGYEIHERVKKFALEQWPWLDDAAEKYYELNVADDE